MAKRVSKGKPVLHVLLSHKTAPSSTRLLDFLEEVERKLKREIKLVAVDGTAMTLLGLKPSTLDIDFTGPSWDIVEFEEAHESLYHSFDVHCWRDGKLFMVSLPKDYMGKSIMIETNLAKIKLFALNPVDIVVTRIARLKQRDWDDIESCVKTYGLTAEEIRERYYSIRYAGSQTSLEANLDLVLSKLSSSQG